MIFMRKLVFLLILLFTYLIFRPILGDVWYTVHDTTHLARVYLLERTLSAGQVPAVWAAELAQGRGYPLFHFYAPLFSHLALALKTVLGSYFIGVKVTLILSALVGAVGMYFLTRRWGRGAGLISAIAYLLLPYAAVNLYVRGAFAEYLSMALLPWMFYLWQDLKLIRSRLLAGLITALFILSHNLIPVLTAPFLLAWIILNRPKKMRLLLLPSLLTLTLSAFYLGPLLFERSFVQADLIARTTNYALHFVDPSQLWNSSWGFGGSGLGIEDGMSFKVGKLHLLLGLAGTLYILLRRPRRELFFACSAVIAAFMATRYSGFIWASIPALPIVQFPWRFLAILGFFVSALSGAGLAFLPTRPLRLIAVVFVIAGLLYLNLKLFTPQTVHPANLASYTSPAYLQTIPQIVPEYAPAYSAPDPEPTDSTILPYTYYPTWEVKLDGVKVPIFPSRDGLLAFSNPTDSPNFTLRQSHTLLENISSIISLLTLIYLLKLYVKT